QCLALQGPLPRSDRPISTSVPDSTAGRAREEHARRRQTDHQSDCDRDRIRTPEPSRASHASGAWREAQDAARDVAITMRKRFFNCCVKTLSSRLVVQNKECAKSNQSFLI